MTVKIAQTLDDFDFTLETKPLDDSNYEDYYVITKEGRGGDPIATLLNKFQKRNEKNWKILFSGFYGCGKSTELMRLKRELDDDFLIKIFSVRERLDPNKVTISELLITVMKDLFYLVKENHSKIKLSKKLLEKLENWTKTIYEEEIKYKYIDGRAGAGLDIQAGFGKVFNVLAKLGLDFNAGRQYKEITSKPVEQTLTELILNCNELIAEIKKQLPKLNKSNVIFIIEDLEKVPLTVAENLFFNYAKQMTSVNCSFIYTFPISLVFNTKYKVIINEFDDNLPLPMIKVHEKDGSDYRPGIESITGILDKRIDKTKKLIPPALLEDFVRMSGGSLRDLFRMLTLAAENATEDNREKIKKEDFQRSVDALKNDYYSTISYNEKTGMNAEEYYNILVDCCNSPDKKPMDVKGLIDLKHNMCILGYNGKGWFDVHPVVKEILKDKQLIDCEQ